MRRVLILFAHPVLERSRVNRGLLRAIEGVEAVTAGIEALIQLGYRAHTAHRLGRKWRAHDEAVLEELVALGNIDREDALQRSRAAMVEAERLMRDEDPLVYGEREVCWNNESLRADQHVDAAAEPTSPEPS